MKAIPFRLLPGQDLKKSCSSFFLDQIAKLNSKNSDLAASVVSAVGSLSVVHLRLAGAKGNVELTGPFEIVSLSGTLSVDGAHLHISVADQEGKVIGGHLMDESLIHTTAEIVILLMEDYSFQRRLDSQTGYRELKIYQN